MYNIIRVHLIQTCIWQIFDTKSFPYSTTVVRLYECVLLTAEQTTKPFYLIIWNKHYTVIKPTLRNNTRSFASTFTLPRLNIINR